jgi:hypothetical protein
MRRRMCGRLFVAVAAMWSAVAMTGNVTHAADFRLGVVNSTFVAKIGDRIIINAFPPGDPSVGGTLTDPSASAVASVSTPINTREDVLSIVAGNDFDVEATTLLRGPVFRAVQLNTQAAFQVSIPTSGSNQRTSLRIAGDGLRALRLTITSGAGATAQLTTFINVVSSNSVSALPVTYVAYIDGAPTLQPDGTIDVADATREQLRDLRDLLIRKPPNVSVAIRIRPELLNGLFRSSDEDRELLRAISAQLSNNETIVSTFRPLDVASYAAAGLKSNFEAQLIRGETILDRTDDAKLSTRAMWMSTDVIDAPSIDFLRALGITNVIAVGNAARALGADTDPNRPYALRSETKGLVFNLADPRYSQLLDDPIGTAYESATAIAAELIAHRNELSRSLVGSAALRARHVVLASASGVPPEPPVAAILLRHLRNSPQIALTRLADFPSSLDGLPRLAPPTAVLVDVATIQARTNQALASVESVRDVLITNEGVIDRWVELIDVANDTSLTDIQRDTYLDGVLTQVASARSAVTLPARSFTFGSRESELRIPLVNQSKFAVSLRLRIMSPTGKMSFTPDTLDVIIPAGEQQEVVIAATARANGLIPVEVTLLSPTGTVLDVAQVRVRMNAIAGLGRGVSVVFLVLLATWWIIHSRRSHKKRTTRQHPALRSQA